MENCDLALNINFISNFESVSKEVKLLLSYERKLVFWCMAMLHSKGEPVSDRNGNQINNYWTEHKVDFFLHNSTIYSKSDKKNSPHFQSLERERDAFIIIIVQPFPSNHFTKFLFVVTSWQNKCLHLSQFVCSYINTSLA